MPLHDLSSTTPLHHPLHACSGTHNLSSTDVALAWLYTSCVLPVHKLHRSCICFRCAWRRKHLAFWSSLACIPMSDSDTAIPETNIPGTQSDFNDDDEGFSSSEEDMARSSTPFFEQTRIVPDSFIASIAPRQLSSRQPTPRLPVLPVPCSRHFMPAPAVLPHLPLVRSPMHVLPLLPLHTPSPACTDAARKKASTRSHQTHACSRIPQLASHLRREIKSSRRHCLAVLPTSGDLGDNHQQVLVLRQAGDDVLVPPHSHQVRTRKGLPWFDNCCRRGRAPLKVLQVSGYVHLHCAAIGAP